MAAEGKEGEGELGGEVGDVLVGLDDAGGDPEHPPDLPTARVQDLGAELGRQLPR